MLLFLFHVSTEESTALPNEETTAVPPGKTSDNMEKRIDRINCVIYVT